MKKSSGRVILFLVYIFSIFYFNNFVSASGNFTTESIEVSVDIPTTPE